MEHLFPEPNTGNQSYPVIITPTANGFILNVVDFDDMSLEADNIQNGIVCLQNILSEKLTGIISPPPTPIQDLVLGAGEFVQMITA